MARFVSGQGAQLGVSGLPGLGTEGHVALVRQSATGVFSCVGAGAAPLDGFDAVAGTGKIAIGAVADSTFRLTMGAGKIGAGSYTICYCNAEQAGDPTNSNCNQDCSYYHQSQTIDMMPHVRLGPADDPGSVRVVGGVPATIRFSASRLAQFAVKNGDYVFASTAGCSTIPTADGTDETQRTQLAGLESTYMTSFISVPTTLTYTDISISGSVKQLSVCYWPQEFSATPTADQILELEDKLYVISAPVLCGGVDCRTFSGGAPNFALVGAPSSGGASGALGLDAGDMIYFRATCAGIHTENHAFATKPLLVTDYLSPEIGQTCDSASTRQRGEVKISTTSMRSTCGYVQRDAHIGSQNAWCAEHENGYDRSDLIRYKYFMIQNEPNTMHPEFTQEYLEMDAGHEFRLWSIMTQGRSETEERVTTYAVSHSLNGVTWTQINDGNGDLKIFNGNVDADTIEYNIFGSTFITRYVRIYPKSWSEHMSMRAGLSGCPTYSTFKLPDSPRLLADGENTRELHACFATRRTGGDTSLEYTALAQKLLVVPQPNDPREDIMIEKGEAWSMNFRIVGESLAPIEGDFLWLQYGDCNNLLTAPVALPSGPNGRMVLQAGGTVTSEMIFNARVNELNIGGYQLCFATKESGGDFDTDYSPITSGLWLFDASPRATLTVPYVASLGTDIVVSWSLAGVASTGHDWIALFNKDACKQTDYTENDPYPRDQAEAMRFAQNRCYLATRDVPKFQSEGELRFHHDDYKIAGTYEVRYFFGDSQNGQGWVCRGMGGLTSGYEDSPTYKSCAMEAKATSNIVTVTKETQYQGSRKKTGGGAVHHLPGLEHSRFAPIGI